MASINAFSGVAIKNPSDFDVILTETYERMLHYAQNLKSPVTMLHMLGIILPILGLVILPLVVSFLQDVRWYSIALLYNIALPLIVFYFGKNILAKRPTGYGDTDISENEEFKKYSLSFKPSRPNTAVLACGAYCFNTSI